MDVAAASLPCALAPVPQHCQASLAGGMEGLRVRCKTAACDDDPSKAFACGDVTSTVDGLAATASACEAPQLQPGSPMQPCSPQLVPAPLRSGHFSPGPCGSGSAAQDEVHRAQTITDAEHSSLAQRKRRGCDGRSDQLCDLVADARAALQQAAASAQQPQPTQTLKRVCSGLSAATTTTTSSLADAGGGLSRLRGATSLPVAIPGCSSGQVSLCAGTWLLGSTQSLSSLQSSPPAGTAACRASKRCSSKAHAAAAAAAAADEEHGRAAAGAKGGRRTLSRSRSIKGSSQSSGSRRGSRAGERAGKAGSQAAGTPSASGASSSGAGSTGQPAARGPRLRLGGRLLTAEEAAAHLKAAAEAAAKAAVAAAAAQKQQQQQQLAAHSAASSEAPVAGMSHVGGSRTASPLSASSGLDLGRGFGSVVRLPSQPICVAAAAKQQQHWAAPQQSPFLACDLQSLLQQQDSCNTGAAARAASGEAGGCDEAVVSSMCVDLPENFIPTPDQAGPWQTLASTLATDDDCSLLQQLQQQGSAQQRPQQQLAAAVLASPTPPAAAQLATAHGLRKMESGQFVSPFVHGPGPLAADIGNAAAAGQQQMCVGLGLAPWCSSSDPAGSSAADSGSHVVLLRPEPVRPAAWLTRAGTGSFASSSSPAGSASIAIPGRGTSDASLAAAASSSASQECGAEQAVDVELQQLLQAWSPAPAAVDSNGSSTGAQHSGFCPLTLKVQQQQTAAPLQQLPAWRSAFAAASCGTTEAVAAAGRASAFAPAATSCMVPTPGAGNGAALAFGDTSAAGTGGFAPLPAAGVAADGLPPPPPQQQQSCSVAQDIGTQPRPCATRRVRVVLGAGGPTAMIDPPPPSSDSPVPHFATPAAAAAAAGGALPADARVVSSLELRALVDGLVAQRTGPSAFRSCCPARQNGLPLAAGGGGGQPSHVVLDGPLAGARAGQGLAAPSSVMVDDILPSMQDLLTDCC